MEDRESFITSQQPATRGVVRRSQNPTFDLQTQPRWDTPPLLCPDYDYLTITKHQRSHLDTTTPKPPNHPTTSQPHTTAPISSSNSIFKTHAHQDAHTHTRTHTMSQEFKYHVAMSCSGCSGAINRVLTKAKGMHLCLSSLSLPLYIHVSSPFKDMTNHDHSRADSLSPPPPLQTQATSTTSRSRSLGSTQRSRRSPTRRIPSSKR